MLEEAAPSLSPLRRRALEVALLLAEPGDAASGCARDRARGARRAARPGRARAGPRRARRRPVARSGLRRRAPDRAPPPARRARRPAGDAAGRTPDVASPVRARPLVPRRTGSTRISLGPLSLGAVHDLLEERLGLELTRPELARVQEATAGNPFFALELGRELVRTNTRPAPGQAVARAREPAGAARRPPRPAAGETARRAAPGRRAGPADGRAGRGRARATGSASSRRWRRPSTRAWSSSTTRASASRTRCSPRSATSRRRSGSAAPCTGRSPVQSRTSRSAPATWRSLPKARTPSSPPSWTPPPSRRPAAGRTAAAAELSELAAELTPGRSCARAAAAPARGTLPPSRRRRRAGGRDARAAARRGSAGVERADVLFALVADIQSRLPRRRIELCDEALAEAVGDDVALDADPRPPEHGTACSRRDVRAALVRRARGAREGRARWRARADRRGDRAGGTRRDLGRRDHPGLARARRRDRGAPRARARVREQPALSHSAAS